MQDKFKNKIQKVKRYFLTNLPTYQLTNSMGFTLIETLVAITVLVLAITGPLQIASNALYSAFYARDQITAYFLAEEAIEYIKNTRDSTFLNDVFNNGNNNNWLLNLSKCADSSTDGTFTGCIIDAKEPNPETAIVACEGGCPPINYDSDTGLWGYAQQINNNKQSKFTRIIEIIPQSNTDLNMTDPVAILGEEAVIKVKVEWETGNYFGNTRSFELTGTMMNWQRK